MTRKLQIIIGSRDAQMLTHPCCSAWWYLSLHLLQFLDCYHLSLWGLIQNFYIWILRQQMLTREPLLKKKKKCQWGSVNLFKSKSQFKTESKNNLFNWLLLQNNSPLTLEVNRLLDIQTEHHVDLFKKNIMFICISFDLCV